MFLFAMSGVRVALLNPSTSTEETRRNFERDIDAELCHFDVQAGELPDAFSYDGCVITGSATSVYWDEPWLPPLKAWVAEAIDRGMPFLGVCYGHQLLADVLGGTVEHMGEFELGYQTVSHSGEVPIMDGIDEEFLVFVSHQDRVAELPASATQFAQNDYGIHGFQHDKVYGVQFHPEYDMETATDVTKEKDIPDTQKDTVLAEITEANYRRACGAKRVFDNFIGILTTQQSPLPAAD